jgi:hypothetical protein
MLEGSSEEYRYMADELQKFDISVFESKMLPCIGNINAFSVTYPQKVLCLCGTETVTRLLEKLHCMSFPHTFGLNQIAGWKHAHAGYAITVAVVAGFWVSVMVHMAFVVDRLALGALLLSLAICHFTTSLHSCCLWPLQSVGCSIK